MLLRRVDTVLFARATIPTIPLRSISRASRLPSSSGCARLLSGRRSLSQCRVEIQVATQDIEEEFAGPRKPLQVNRYSHLGHPKSSAPCDSHYSCGWLADRQLVSLKRIPDSERD